MPEFQTDTRFASAYHIYHNRQRHRLNYGKIDEYQGQLNLQAYNMTGYVYRATDSPADWLVKLEYVCIGWFSLEYILR
jgi:hypothetical protein